LVVVAVVVAAAAGIAVYFAADYADD